MRYSIEPKDRTYVKGYEFLVFAKNLSGKYSQKNFLIVLHLQLKLLNNLQQIH